MVLLKAAMPGRTSDSFLRNVAMDGAIFLK